MDLTDQFVRDGVFGEHAYIHLFPGSENKAAREGWLRDIDQICKAVGIAYVVRETQEDGKPAYEFGFADKIAYAAFMFNAIGDLEKERGHVQICRFGNETTEERETFFLAAQAHLAALGIEYHWRVENNALEFAFDSLSDRMVFDALIEKGIIETSAKGLALARSFQRCLGTGVSHPLRNHGFDPG